MAKTKYLVDTHIFLWMVFEPEKIKPHLLDVIENEEHEVLIASVSFWEISIKYNLGKLKLHGYTPAELLDLASKMAVNVIDIDSSTMASFYKLPKVAKHKDPFDRLVIWQCIQQDYVLLSQDTKFVAYAEFGLRMFESS